MKDIFKGCIIGTIVGIIISIVKTIFCRRNNSEEE